MSKNLVIVESPAKAKTIEKFLGKDFHVLSSQGHIRDIEGIGKNSMGIDFEHNYAPHYAVDPQKKHLVETLKAESKKAETIWLASDEDREGEAIAWHLKEVLSLNDNTTKRIVFHEITKTAILDAITHPRMIDYNLVNAQQARRVLDRIVGFELSPVLWKKIIPGLSAGRVQSVAVRLIVEREREIQEFKPAESYRVTADFIGENTKGENVSLHTELNHRFKTEEDAIEFLNQCKDAHFHISNIQHKPAKRQPAPPFTTSSLQQEAARKLHFPVAKTMRLAQSLYESGHITYMRTDSVNLSGLALGTAKQEITSLFGNSYHKTRQYHTTTKGAQEAHEAIRPSYIDRHSAGANADEKKLYELIWKRTLASQMADAELEQTRIEVTGTYNNQDFIFVATGEVIVFDGFMKLYIQSNDDEAEDNGNSTLPQMKENSNLCLKEAVSIQSFSKPPFRYTEGSLVKKMEELEIGRPSTYATIIETIQQRGYVERGNKTGVKREYTIISLKNNKITSKKKTETYGADSQKLIPTDLGFTTNDYLVNQFPTILSYDFTAKAEADFDEIAEGKLEWVKMVDSFYKTFHPTITNVSSGKIAGRELGTDPKTGKLVIAKIGKKGPCIQIGTADDSDKPRFASLAKGQSIYTITLEEALELFNTPYPYTVGEFEGETLIVNEGMYGPYIKMGKTFISIPKNADPLNISLDYAIELIKNKQKASMPIHEWGDIQVLQGRFGAYIKQGVKNYKLPKGTDANSLTEEQCRKIIASSQPTEGRRTIKRTKKTK